MNYSYERVSTVKQDERRQELSLDAYKIDCRYVDKCSGKNTDRPKLKMLLNVVKRGDHIYVESISRLGRNVDDLRKLTEDFCNKGVTVHFIKEGFDTNGNMYKFMLTILGAVAEMERELIVERVREGVEKAQKFGTKSGRPIGRPEPELPKDFSKYYEKMKSGEITKVELGKLLGISRATTYRWIEQYESRSN